MTVVMSLHKLTAGDGYTYLTRQVAAHDATGRGYQSLGDYYAQHGESPGRWLGRGLNGLTGLTAGQLVTEEQMKALFGEGRHPDADRIERAVIAAGGTPAEALTASALGRRFPIYQAVNRYRRIVAARFGDWNGEQGLPRDWPVPADERARIRSAVAREMFAAEFGRQPADARELAGYVARASRQPTTAVAGYDLTFSPVKSVSTLWAIAPAELAGQIEAAHQAAVADTLKWLEDNAAYTRTGLRGVRQVEVRGLIAAAFTHRDSRAGDPDLHTHVAVSNKVQTRDGRWLALDGRVMYKSNVAASERYNTRLEAELIGRLGVAFAERAPAEPGKRCVREIVGVDERLTGVWSARRASIDVRRGELATRFQAEHGRPPSVVEAIALAQQATLETRQAKHEPRSYAAQRAAWRQQALDVLGGPQRLAGMIHRSLHPPPRRPVEVTETWTRRTAEQVVDVVQAGRATWQECHIRAEAERSVRAAGVGRAAVDAAVEQIVTVALSPAVSVPVGVPEPVTEPAALRRSEGSSVYTVAGAQLYTSERILVAERVLVAAAGRRDGRGVPASGVELALLESAANGVELNPGQALLVRELAGSGARLQLALAPAGTGKTTAMRVLARAWSDGGGQVIGLAPSAAAAAVLREELGSHTDTLAQLLWSVDTGSRPGWVGDIGPDTLVVIDEAGMAGTVELARAVEYVLARGGSVRLVGDDQQLAALAAGGVLRDIAETAGAVTLSQVVRFLDPAEGAASLAIRAGDPAGIGFYVDRGRVHVGDLATACDHAYQHWSADRAAGRDAVMLAPTRELVATLNARARADRIAQPGGQPGREVTLADGSRASAGDTVITRRNNRTLTITATDWVKNGDRWTVLKVRRCGALDVTHHGTNRRITLPADYVTDHVTLGYAATVHTAQGITAEICHTVATGQETRQLLYVALTRGRAGNHLHLVTATDGDPHGVVTPAALFPPTAIDTLTAVLARDGAQHSATSLTRESADPAGQLGEAAARYYDALTAAAEQHIGTERLGGIDRAAEQVRPGLPTRPAYPSLRAHLALLAVDGHDPQTVLTAAAAQRELATAEDPAAVLDWRLDPTDRHTTTPGPLPWLPGVPAPLTADPRWGPYLTARRRLIGDLAAAVAEHAGGYTPTSAPPWATGLLDQDPVLLTDLAIWRAATGVDDTDHRPTGPTQPAAAAARHQRHLDRQAAALLGQPGAAAQRWAPLAAAIDPRITADPYWPQLADRLAAADRAGINIQALAAGVGRQHPLPDELPAAALWWRLSRHLSPAALAATADPPAAALRPDWTPVLSQALGPQLAQRVRADPAWPAPVAAVTTATRAGWQPADLLGTPHQLPTGPDGQPIPGGELATALLWRIGTLTDAAPFDPHWDTGVAPDPADPQPQQDIHIAAPAGAIRSGDSPDVPDHLAEREPYFDADPDDIAPPAPGTGWDDALFIELPYADLDPDARVQRLRADLAAARSELLINS